MFIRQAQLTQAARPFQTIQLPAVIIAVGHRAAAIGLLRTYVYRNLLTTWIDLTFLLGIHYFLVSSQGVNRYSHSILRDAVPTSWSWRTLA